MIETIMLIVVIFVLSGVFWYSFFYQKEKKLFNRLQRMLDCAIDGELERTEISEEKYSALENSMKQYIDSSFLAKKNQQEVDEELVMEVTDNLLENAVRYAQKSIALQIKKKDGFLIISVEDDGIGFVDTEEKVTEPFYHKNPQDDLKHFGLGMYISRIFCEKHGGNLKIYNARQGGAHVEALFKAE